MKDAGSLAEEKQLSAFLLLLLILDVALQMKRKQKSVSQCRLQRDHSGGLDFADYLERHNICLEFPGFCFFFFNILHHTECLCWEESKITRNCVIFSPFYRTCFMIIGVSQNLVRFPRSL